MERLIDAIFRVLAQNPAGVLSSALATMPRANGVLFLFRAPAIDYIDAEAPFGPDSKTGQLFRAQQPIHSGWVYPQVLGQLSHRQNPRWGRG